MITKEIVTMVQNSFKGRIPESNEVADWAVEHLPRVNVFEEMYNRLIIDLNKFNDDALLNLMPRVKALKEIMGGC